MIKRIQNLTKKEKQRFLEQTIIEIEKTGIPWNTYKARIMEDLDATFDDEKFAKMNPDFAIDAAYARQYFGKNKPELADYMLWMMQFTTKSDLIEIPD